MILLCVHNGLQSKEKFKLDEGKMRKGVKQKFTCSVSYSKSANCMTIASSALCI